MGVRIRPSDPGALCRSSDGKGSLRFGEAVQEIGEKIGVERHKFAKDKRDFVERHALRNEILNHLCHLVLGDQRNGFVHAACPHIQGGVIRAFRPVERTATPLPSRAIGANQAAMTMIATMQVWWRGA